MFKVRRRISFGEMFCLVVACASFHGRDRHVRNGLVWVPEDAPFRDHENSMARHVM